MMNLEFKTQGTKYQMFSKFWDLLQGAKGAQSYEFSRMRAQFLLCHICIEDLEESLSRGTLRHYRIC